MNVRIVALILGVIVSGWIAVAAAKSQDCCPGDCCPDKSAPPKPGSGDQPVCAIPSTG